MGAELTGRRSGLDQWLLAVAGDVEEKVSVGEGWRGEPALKKRDELERSNWVGVLVEIRSVILQVFWGVDLVN
jgi:hypothetical protein